MAHAKRSSEIQISYLTEQAKLRLEKFVYKLSLAEPVNFFLASLKASKRVFEFFRLIITVEECDFN